MNTNPSAIEMAQENARIQTESHMRHIKNEARMEAIRIATRINDRAEPAGLPGVKTSHPGVNKVIADAELIYKFLTQDIDAQSK
jgi:hypothetical protein